MKKKPKRSEKMPSYIGILIDQFDAKFNLLIEGYAALDKKIDQKIDDLRKEINDRFDAVEQRLFAIEERLDQHDHQFEVVFEELHKLQVSRYNR